MSLFLLSFLPAEIVQGGVRGLWKGWVPNCQRAALVQVGDLTTYDATKQFLRRRFDFPDGPLLHAVCSGAAGMVAATLGAPADVVKTRVMNQVRSAALSPGIRLVSATGAYLISPALSACAPAACSC
jgi:hypothetical protein